MPRRQKVRRQSRIKFLKSTNLFRMQSLNNNIWETQNKSYTCNNFLLRQKCIFTFEFPFNFDHSGFSKNQKKMTNLAILQRCFWGLLYIVVGQSSLVFLNKHLLNINTHIGGLPLWLSNKESTCEAENAGDSDVIPGSGRSRGGENMAIHSSILSWRIPWREEPGGLQSMGSQRVRQD